MKHFRMSLVPCGTPSKGIMRDPAVTKCQPYMFDGESPAMAKLLVDYFGKHPKNIYHHYQGLYIMNAVFGVVVVVAFSQSPPRCIQRSSGLPALGVWMFGVGSPSNYGEAEAVACGTNGPRRRTDAWCRAEPLELDWLVHRPSAVNENRGIQSALYLPALFISHSYPG